MKKLDKKGFSLVELIIVIAIMAVLVGVLAPTYMQYVERSRQSNDVNLVDAIVTACEVVAIDPAVPLDQRAKTVNIVISTTALTIKEDGKTDETTVASYAAAIRAIVGDSNKLKSSSWGSDLTIKVVPGANGKVEFTISDGAGDKFKTYAAELGSKSNVTLD